MAAACPGIYIIDCPNGAQIRPPIPIAAGKEIANSNDTETPPISAEGMRAIRDLFLRQAAAENAHDIDGIESVLAPAVSGQPDAVTFVARAYRFWGRETVIDHFREVFAGTWRFEPDEEEIRIVPLGPDTAHIYAPTRITAGPAGQPGLTRIYLVNEFAVRTREGWRVSVIVPVPAE